MARSPGWRGRLFNNRSTPQTHSQHNLRQRQRNVPIESHSCTVSHLEPHEALSHHICIHHNIHAHISSIEATIRLSCRECLLRCCSRARFLTRRRRATGQTRRQPLLLSSHAARRPGGVWDRPNRRIGHSRPISRLAAISDTISLPSQMPSQMPSPRCHDLAAISSATISRCHLQCHAISPSSTRATPRRRPCHIPGTCHTIPGTCDTR